MKYANWKAQLPRTYHRSPARKHIAGATFLRSTSGSIARFMHLVMDPSSMPARLRAVVGLRYSVRRRRNIRLPAHNIVLACLGRQFAISSSNTCLHTLQVHHDSTPTGKHFNTALPQDGGHLTNAGYVDRSTLY